MRKPNFLILMTDQLNGTLFPDGPAEWLHAPHLKAAGRTLGQVQARIHAFASMRACPSLVHDGPTSQQNARLRQRGRVLIGIADIRASFAARGILHLPIGKNAFRRPRSASRLRGTANHRHLSGGLRMDAGLQNPRCAGRLVVSQSGLGQLGRNRGNHESTRVRRRSRPRWLLKSSTNWRAATTSGLGA